MRALVTGVSGQDGHYLSELLLSKGYEVFGMVRRSSAAPRIPAGVVPVQGDMLDAHSLSNVIAETKPDEVYNLAAQSHVGESFQQPFVTAQINGLGAHALFEAIRNIVPKARVYQASTSEQFGGLEDTPYSETSPFHPRSPYGCAKVYAHQMAVFYREAYGLHISCGILFNHESPRRGEEFVTRKITRAIGRILAGTQSVLTLGNLNAVRDWGYAGDYVLAMHEMLQMNSADDYVIATGESHDVVDFLNLAFDIANLPRARYVKTDITLLRPSDVHTLRADPSKATKALGWKPTVSFHGLVERMVTADIALAKHELLSL